MPNTEIIDKVFKDKDYSYEAGRAGYLFYIYIVNSAYTITDVPFYPRMFTSSVGAVSTFHNHLTKWWYVTDKSESPYNKALEYFLNNSNALFEFEQNILSCKALLKTAIKDKNPDTLNRDELKTLFKEYVKILRRILVSPSVCRLLDRASIAYAKKVSINESDFGVIFANEDPSFAYLEEVEALNIAIDKSNNTITDDQFEKNIEDLRNKYSWSTRGYYNEKSKNIEDYKNWITKLIQNNPEARKKALEDNQKEILAHKELLLKPLSDQDKKVIKIGSKSSHLKDIFKFTLNELIERFDPYFNAIAHLVNVDSEILRHMLPQEIEQLLDGKEVDLSHVQQRAEKNVIFVMADTYEVYEGDDADYIEETYLAESSAKKSEYKGRVASKGKAIGIVKVITKPNEFKKFEKGDILVVVNTSPDFVPIMSMAAAIIGEEGGITAHISVVSRELKVPCVVGVNNITKILKDGDKVEVDAEKGIIKIIT